MKKFTVSALAIAALAGSAVAQTAPVRLEFRLIPQTGTPPATVTDLAETTAGTPIAISGSARTQRYELQYRVLDLDPNDAVFVPAGLSACQINITASNAASGTMARAQLSRFEGQLAGTTPPTSPDSSGLPTGAASVRTGLHAPYRGGMSNQNDNTLAANGTVAGSAINGILPLAISQTNQGNANNGIDNTAWYGLYSFTFTAADNFGGALTITAEAIADPNTQNRFGWFNDGSAVPEQSANATSATTHLAITAVPAPGAAALIGLGGLLAARRRRA
ncbi:MAG: hypothetical protein IT438_09535 [Phycisphaerales bacterium]|nr:hypothetical protein [Phycisphaerales bacterium]